ncbi:MAG: cell division protein FtsZ, partial [Candidatus Shapirobacteria bacterium]|nr:cell division protein FtsZ [Candidatus Shapirobacteria bacterium]
GTRRMTNAEEGISQLRNNVDTLIVIPNQKVMEVVNNKATLLEAFKIADSVLNKGTKAIADLITVPGLINLDFADIKAVMSNAGSALMGVGEAEGDNRSQLAVEAAIQSPLVEADIEGARGVLINITGGPDLTMAEIEEAARTITQRTAPDANIIFGATIDPELKGKIKISVIATGFDSTKTHFYQSFKKPILTPPVTSNPLPQTPPKEVIETIPVDNQEIKKYLGDKDIPAGIDIVDEFDIPAFLRKKN